MKRDMQYPYDPRKATHGSTAELASEQLAALQVLPRFLRYSLYLAVAILSVIGLFYLGRSYGPISATVVLDAWIIIFVTASITRGRTRSILLALFIAFYALSRIIPALWLEAPLQDFLQAYRWLLYLLAFVLAVGRFWGPIDGLIKATWALVLAATAKGAATLVLVGSGERPGLLLENNFELALFCGLAAALYQHMGRHRGALIVTLGVLTVLSGSRSGAVIFVILAIYAVTQMRAMNLFVRYLVAAAAVAATAIPVMIFAERASSATFRIDRLNFLDVFFAEVGAWNAGQWIFGTTPITPLSPNSCASLANYEQLFASSGDGTCYAVILHAFLLRVIFDAGLLGLALAIVIPWLAMRKAGVSLPLALTLSCIALANGASVSGLNNPYVALPVIVAILTTRAFSAPSEDDETAARQPSVT